MVDVRHDCLVRWPGRNSIPDASAAVVVVLLMLVLLVLVSAAATTTQDGKKEARRERCSIQHPTSGPNWHACSRLDGKILRAVRDWNGGCCCLFLWTFAQNLAPGR